MARADTLGSVHPESLAELPAPQDGPTPTHRFIVCGDSPLAFRLISELTERHGAEVAVIMPSSEENQGPRIGRLPGVDVIESRRLDEETFARAGLAEATAVALIAQDDAGNVDAALLIQDLSPDTRIVMRVFNLSLGESLTKLLRNCVVLSATQIAAPAFVTAALGETAMAPMEFGGRTLTATRRVDVRAEDVLCGLAVTDGSDDPLLLPADQNAADLVLARYKALPRLRLPRRRRHRLRRLWLLVGRRLRIVLLLALLLLVAGTAVFAWSRHIGWAEAAYITVLTALGGANPDGRLSGVEQIVQTVLTIASIAVIPLITALVVDVLVKARLTLATGGLIGPISGHVVVMGLGNVGTRVVRSLYERGIEVVAIDQDPQAVGVPVARELNVPLIIADGSRIETLRAASVHTSRALIIVSAEDVVNLETALAARALKADLRVVLRIFDGEFADRVDRAFGIGISRSVSYLSAPAFAAAMLDQEIIATIPVRRRVLLIAEIPVHPGSAMEGRPAIEIQRAGESRLLAIRTGRGAQTLWAPSPGRRIARSERLIVVATRAGLGHLLARTAPRPADVAARTQPLPFPPVEPFPFGTPETSAN